MTEFLELVAIPDGPHAPAKCPFCPIDKEKAGPPSYIGKDNKSKTLGTNLESIGDKKSDHLYQDSDYGTYSAEAHHAICGNEVLAEEAELEAYLIEQGKSTTKGGAGLLKPGDVGYDVNCAENGIWLPLVPYMFMAGKKSPETWWGDQSGWNRRHPRRRKRKTLGEDEKEEIAFAVMEHVQRQFHKGPHGSVGEPHNNYVVMAIGRLRQITAFVTHFKEICPMEDDGQPKTDPPFYPPFGVIALLHALSLNLKKELQGPPETWNYFISTFALDCANYWKS